MKLIIYGPQRDGRLNWPSCPDTLQTVYPQSGHLSTIDRAQKKSASKTPTS